MKAVALEAIKTARRIIQPGEVIEIDGPLLERLAGRVRVIEGSPTASDLHRLIGEALAEIDAAGRPWTGWRKNLTPEAREHLLRIEAQIDAACLASDLRGVVAALAEYRNKTLGTKKEGTHAA